VRRLAERLTEQMKQGARFSAVAQQFSQSATAPSGRYRLGACRAAQPGARQGGRPDAAGRIVPPIRTGAATTCCSLSTGAPAVPPARKKPCCTSSRSYFRSRPGTRSHARATILEAQGAKATAKNCEEAPQNRQREGFATTVERGRLRVEQIAPAMRNIVLGLDLGSPRSRSFKRTGSGDYVCEKAAAPSSPTVPSREMSAKR